MTMRYVYLSYTLSWLTDLSLGTTHRQGGHGTSLLRWSPRCAGRDGPEQRSISIMKQWLAMNYVIP